MVTQRPRTRAARMVALLLAAGMAATSLAPARADGRDDLAYGPDRLQVLDLHLPPAAGRPVPVVVYFHGGAFVGGASYSIYLIHTLAIGLAAKVLMKAGLAKGGWDVAMLPVAAAAVAAGMVLFIAVERPLLRLAKMRAPAVLEVS